VTYWPPPKPNNLEAPSATHTYTLPGFTVRYDKLLTDNEGDHNQWKPCQHYKRWTDPSSVKPPYGLVWYSKSFSDVGKYISNVPTEPLLLTQGSQFNGTFGPWGSHTNGLPPFMVTDIGDGFIPKPVGLDVLVDASLKKMLPDIKAELSLVNSVIELKDFESLPTTLTRLKSLIEDVLPLFTVNTAKRLIRLSRGMRKLRGTFSSDLGATLRELVQGTADGYLQQEFNVLPLLSDISGVFTALSRTERAINDLIVRRGKLQSKHYQYVYFDKVYTADPLIAGSNALSTGIFAGTTTVPGWISVYKKHGHAFKMTRWVEVNSPAEFHAQVEYSYYFTQFQLEHAQVLGLLDALGVNLNPTIIWNAIPWSFVVDWVLGVNRWLNGRKTLNMEPVVNIKRYLWSHRHTRTTRIYAESVNGSELPWPRVYTWLPDMYEVAYRRDVGIPYTNSFLTSELSNKEITLGVALAVTRRRRSNTRVR
jgi:hypothetical protein